MKEVAGAAVADWRERHICLPSLIIASFMVGGGIFLQDIESEKKAALTDIPVIVRLHNDYLATWKGKGQSRPNWEKLLGECHYILAVQYLQDAEYPYSMEREYEEKIVGMIERNGLIRFDGTRK